MAETKEMTESDLKEIVATLGRTDASRISAGTALDGSLASSLVRARLAVMLRSRYSITDSAVYQVSTFGELCSVCGLGQASPGALTEAPHAFKLNVAESSDVSFGVDIESIAAMPDVADLWEDSFYRETFTHQEIAYANLQTSPKASLAAMWSAKEAVRKAIPGLQWVDWQRIEVTHDANGKPGIAVDGTPLAGALSLSHTDDAAFAAFVSVPLPKIPSPIAPLLPPAVAPASSINPRNTTAFLALFVSIVALLLAFFRH